MFYNQFPEERLNFVWPRIEKDDIIIFGSYFALNPALRKRYASWWNLPKREKQSSITILTFAMPMPMKL